MNSPPTAITNSNHNRVPIPELNNQILVDRKTGQIFLNGPVLSLTFPMIIVRHGQTNGNQRKVLQGQADGPENQLNETGKIQAQQGAITLFNELKDTLGSRFLEMADRGNVIVLKSPITRAQDTAHIFVDCFKEQTGISLECNVEEGLKEMSFGIIDGLALEAIQEESLREMLVRYRTTQDATINWHGTGESFIDALIRAKILIERLNHLYEGKQVVVVSFTHGTLCSALRTVVGEKSLLKEDNLIAFKDNILGNAAFHWLSQEEVLLDVLETTGSHSSRVPGEEISPPLPTIAPFPGLAPPSHDVPFGAKTFP